MLEPEQFPAAGWKHASSRRSCLLLPFIVYCIKEAHGCGSLQSRTTLSESSNESERAFHCSNTTSKMLKLSYVHQPIHRGLFKAASIQNSKLHHLYTHLRWGKARVTPNQKNHVSLTGLWRRCFALTRLQRTSSHPAWIITMARAILPG